MTYIHFAQLFGLISTILALCVLFNLSDARHMAKELVTSPAGYIMAGVLPVIFGAWTVLQVQSSHHGWALVVHLIGWLMLLFGVFRLWFARLWLRFVGQHIDDAPILYALFGLMVGLLLLYIGFIA